MAKKQLVALPDGSVVAPLGQRITVQEFFNKQRPASTASRLVSSRRPTRDIDPMYDDVIVYGQVGTHRREV